MEMEPMQMQFRFYIRTFTTILFCIYVLSHSTEGSVSRVKRREMQNNENSNTQQRDNGKSVQHKYRKLQVSVDKNIYFTK